ncbi:54S ribosomal protein L6, mitochondrial [Lachnellula willkommii]|uniref:Large ribosomal subunit protein uL6m n=1 Tax=Lachnellula willkommii TaxID=215461 RepID=A0A559MHK3_9HELO|nr:54S ribosomal protein L6, mitochondrial [Lachnellula willkommii]
MLSSARSKGLERAIASAPSASIPAFLLPAFPIASSRSFSSSPSRASQIGRAPLSIPPGVDFNVLPPPARKNGYFSPVVAKSTVRIEGPLGKMSMTIPPFIKLEHDAATRKAFVTVEDKEVKKQREMWGTTRAYLQNHILGVSEGHTAILRLVGVGYRATVENTATTVQPEFEGQQFVSLKVGQGFCSTADENIARGCGEGSDSSVCSQDTNVEKPEPYKGKGIFVNGETIKLKAKKIK